VDADGTPRMDHSHVETLEDCMLQPDADNAI